MDVREIETDELAALVEVHNAVRPHERTSVAGLVDWRRQASDTVWVLARDGERPVGGGLGVIGWHSRPGVALVEVWTLPAERGSGVGTAVFGDLARWAGERGCIELTTAVDEDDPSSLAWAEGHGFREIGRNTRLVLDLAGLEPPRIAPPAGIAVTTWAARPGIERGLYAVYCEAEPDIPDEEHNQQPSFEEWLANDMQGASDRPEAVFVALAGDEVVGYAKLSLTDEDGTVAYHDLTGVLRAWRGRGIASALKRAQIAWAANHGYTRLVTANHERNLPIRRLNERHGYRAEPGRIVLHTMLDASE
ncbi:MAG: GNAT family N-acetyltransferase [Gaiella sp.]